MAGKNGLEDGIVIALAPGGGLAPCCPAHRPLRGARTLPSGISVLQKIAPVRFAPVRREPLRSAFERFAPRRSAPRKSVPLTSESDTFMPRRSAPRRSEPTIAPKFKSRRRRSTPRSYGNVKPEHVSAGPAISGGRKSARAGVVPTKLAPARSALRKSECVINALASELPARSAPAKLANGTNAPDRFWPGSCTPTHDAR